MPLQKKLFVAARAMCIRVANQYKGETEGKNGLAAVPIDIEPTIERNLEHLAREQRTRLQKQEIKEFLEYMTKQNVIAKHPWGGYMTPQDKPIPPVTDAKKLVHEQMAKINGK